MEEYAVIYREGDVYRIIDKIYSEDSAYTILAMVIELGFLDSRIEEIIK